MCATAANGTVTDVEGRRILQLHLTPIVDSGIGRHAEPFLGYSRYRLYDHARVGVIVGRSARKHRDDLAGRVTDNRHYRGASSTAGVKTDLIPKVHHHDEVAIFSHYRWQFHRLRDRIINKGNGVERTLRLVRQFVFGTRDRQCFVHVIRMPWRPAVPLSPMHPRSRTQSWA